MLVCKVPHWQFFLAISLKHSSLHVFVAVNNNTTMLILFAVSGSWNVFSTVLLMCTYLPMYCIVVYEIERHEYEAG